MTEGASALVLPPHSHTWCTSERGPVTGQNNPECRFQATQPGAPTARQRAATDDHAIVAPGQHLAGDALGEPTTSADECAGRVRRDLRSDLTEGACRLALVVRDQVRGMGTRKTGPIDQARGRPHPHHGEHRGVVSRKRARALQYPVVLAVTDDGEHTAEGGARLGATVASHLM